MKLVPALLSVISAGLALMAEGKTHLLDQFTPESFKEWVTSDWKGAENMGKWDISAGEWYGGKLPFVLPHS